MLGVKAGDIDKMGLLFERHHKQLFGFVYHMTGKVAYSEDLVQTVFYRMLKYRHTFKGDGEFKTWMYHLSRNLIKDTFRKSNRIDYLDDLSLHTSEMKSENMDDEMERKEESERLHKAVSKLRNDSKEVLVLSKFQEMSYREIADVLKISEANVKVKVHRAMTELKKVYLIKER
ncbi:MAG: RNA polymerase sigma factor [Cytophagales bacterium]|nr:RNA polymerase sigma factor [Cytophagales bacterium]